MGGTALTYAADNAARSPATVAEAGKTLDLATFPILEKAETPASRRLASLSYSVSGEVSRVFETQRRELTNRKWTELPNSYVTDQAASGSFTKDGYSLSLMVYPAGAPGKVSVTLNNHGNVALAKLPVPPGAKPFFGGPVNIMYVTEAPVVETTEACRKLLLERGWEPYGDAGDTRYYKQNAVRLSARASSAPAQGGKTIIDYSTVLMSVDLPAPTETEGLQYADVTTHLQFETKAAESEMVDFYRQTLAKAGWEATTENPVKSGFQSVLIFRNPQKDLLTLELQSVKATGKSRVNLKHQTAAEVAEIDQRIKAKVERRVMEKNKPLPKLNLPLPADARDVTSTKDLIEFKVPPQRAKAIADAWRAQFVKDGWDLKSSRLEEMEGLLILTKEGLNQTLTLIYTDLRVLPAEVRIQASGVELVRAVAGKK